MLRIKIDSAGALKIRFVFHSERRQCDARKRGKTDDFVESIGQVLRFKDTRHRTVVLQRAFLRNSPFEQLFEHINGERRRIKQQKIG